MSISYSAFRTAIKGELFPFPGEPKSLVAAHDKFMVEAMIQVQKWVPQLAVNHTSVFAACSTYVECGLSVVEAPVGVIKRVYTIANAEWCDRVFYSGRSHREILQWQRCLMLSFKNPTNTGMPALQQGFKFAEASTDSAVGRARTGIWSIDRKRFYLAPWLQSNESLVIEWDGAKAIWNDTDLLDQNYWDAEAAAVVKLYVQKSHERDFGCDRQKLRDLETDYAFKLGNLAHTWNQRTENQENTDAEELNTRGPTGAELADDAPLAISGETVSAYIADYDGGAATLDVAALVNGWKPAYVVTGGDNWYGTELTLASLDASVGPGYSRYIYPYLGSLGAGADVENKFFPAIGNHERDPVGRLSIFKNYFNRTKEYYDFVKGHIHWFIVDGGYMNDKTTMVQADGNTSNSVQGEFFRLKMALSTARWKIVVVPFQPYASSTPEFPALRWPYKLWGADLVLTGDKHAYERILAPEGYPLITGGWSGRTLSPFAGGISPYSVVRYDANYGALKLTSSCDKLKVEAITRVGVVVDTLTLTKA